MTEATAPCVQTGEQLLGVLLGNRALTRRVIDAFPEAELFNYGSGGLRPFAQQITELLNFSEPLFLGVATGDWGTFPSIPMPETKEALLKAWDDATLAITRLWDTIPAHRFDEEDSVFGVFSTTGRFAIQYALENEIHHRGQAYVYLRELGIEPPPFWQR